MAFPNVRLKVCTSNFAKVSIKEWQPIKIPDLRKINRALISVSDKTGIVDFARQLKEFGVEIISTGGTAERYARPGSKYATSADVTGFPEMMDGRVKTLHPKIHGGLLGIRGNSEHQAAMVNHGIEPIDLVVVNLYPFEETIEREGVTRDEVIEQIDIGGPAMIRSAAKNFKDVAVVISPYFYAEIIEELAANQGALAISTRTRLSMQAFGSTTGYDRVIFAYLASMVLEPAAGSVPGQPSSGDSPQPASDHFSIQVFDKLLGVELKLETEGSFPDNISLLSEKKDDLRYGENPHQRAALYKTGEDGGVANVEQLGGKEMSFNNYVDADAAWQLVCDFEELACAIIKHTNPAGVGLGNTAEEAYRKALATDPVSAFGGIVAFNRQVDTAAARSMTEIFTEVIVAPDYEPSALEVLQAKKNLRVLRAVKMLAGIRLEYRQIGGGMLMQTRDTHQLSRDDLKIVIPATAY